MIEDQGSVLEELRNHDQLMKEYHITTIQAIDDQRALVQGEIAESFATASKGNKYEHHKTREYIHNAGSRIAEGTQAIHGHITHEIRSVEVEVQGAISTNREQNTAHHTESQSQIADLKEIIKLMGIQMKDRDKELRELLSALNSTKAPKKRQLLCERSNAVTAALFGLQTTCQSLQVRIGPHTRLLY